MADLPIIFSAPMVRALLEGRKTQTRRMPKINWKDGANQNFTGWRPERVGPRQWQLVGGMGVGATIKTAYAPGDRLYVREAHVLLPATAYRQSVGTGTIAQVEHPTDGYTAAVFREGFDRSGRPRWRPSIHMPRWASRLTLTVTDVRVQRLQEISEADAVAEGVIPIVEPDDLKWEHYAPHGVAFRDLWDSLHGPEAWDANPWVAAYSFSVARGNIDQIGGAA